MHENRPVVARMHHLRRYLSSRSSSVRIDRSFLSRMSATVRGRGQRRLPRSCRCARSTPWTIGPWSRLVSASLREDGVDVLKVDN